MHQVRQFSSRLPARLMKSRYEDIGVSNFAWPRPNVRDAMSRRIIPSFDFNFKAATLATSSIYPKVLPYAVEGPVWKQVITKLRGLIPAEI